MDARRIPMCLQQRPPFDALYVRVRPQIVVDGLAPADASEPEANGQGSSSEGRLQHYDARVALGEDGNDSTGGAQEAADRTSRYEAQSGSSVPEEGKGDDVAVLDWNNNGEEVSALAWHERLKHKRHAAADAADTDDVVVLDCRNAYESDVGKFEGALALNTNTFR